MSATPRDMVATHMGDNDSESYEEANWARLSPVFRRAHNRLRMARGLSPTPELKGDPPPDPVYQRPTRPLRTFTSEQWARLPPPLRAAYNNLRRQRYLAPIPEPAVDRSPRSPVTPKLLDPGPLAHEVARTEDPALFKKLVSATESILKAADGDMDILEKRMREGVATPEERRVAVRLLAGEKRPAHRPSTWSRKLRVRTAESFLRAWYYAEPKQRGSQNEAIRFCVHAYRVTRAEGFEILGRIRAEVVEDAERGNDYCSARVDAATAARAPEGFQRRTTKA